MQSITLDAGNGRWINKPRKELRIFKNIGRDKFVLSVFKCAMFEFDDVRKFAMSNPNQMQIEKTRTDE